MTSKKPAGRRSTVKAVEIIPTRGQKLYEAMIAYGPWDESQRVLLEEACRIADRLDKLDAQLETQSAWFNFSVDLDGGYAEVTVTCDRVLSEARLQAVALKSIVAELRQGRKPASVPTKGGGSVGDLRSAARRKQASG